MTQIACSECGLTMAQSRQLAANDEPTEEMLVAGLKECEPLGELIDWREGFGREEMRSVWMAMIEARSNAQDQPGRTD